MREIDVREITKAVCDAFLKANTDVIKVRDFLCDIKDREKSQTGKIIIDQLIENANIAKDLSIPSCQDTGMAVVFCRVGRDVHISGGGLEDAVNAGVRIAYDKGRFRKSVVDPITRENTKDNTPAIIHWEFAEGDRVEITVLPKGFGSENMSAIGMLTPAVGLEGVLDFIVETVKTRGANACPPLVVGVGIGGTFEKCALMAKHSLMRDLGSANEDGELQKLEELLLDRINSLDIGPMGLGGNITALGVFIEKYPTHIAGLPVAVNMMCHALRHERVVL